MPAAPAWSNPDTLLHGTGKLRMDWTLRGLLPASKYESRTHRPGGDERPARSDGLGNYTDKPKMGILTQHLATP